MRKPESFLERRHIPSAEQNRTHTNQRIFPARQVEQFWDLHNKGVSIGATPKNSPHHRFQNSLFYNFVAISIFTVLHFRGKRPFRAFQHVIIFQNNISSPSW